MNVCMNVIQTYYICHVVVISDLPVVMAISKHCFKKLQTFANVLFQSLFRSIYQTARIMWFQ